MKEHFNLTGKQGPATKWEFPANKETIVIRNHLADRPLRYAQVGLSLSWSNEQQTLLKLVFFFQQGSGKGQQLD